MHANQLFIQYTVKTGERGEKEIERERGGGGGGEGAGGGQEGKGGMQQQARVIDMKRVHSCLDVVILNGRRMDRSWRAIRLHCIVLCILFYTYVCALYTSFLCVYIYMCFFILFYVN